MPYVDLCSSGLLVPRPGLAGLILYLPVGIWEGFWQCFDHKNVPAVPGIYTGFASRKVSIPAIPNDWCVRNTHSGVTNSSINVLLFAESILDCKLAI